MAPRPARSMPVRVVHVWYMWMFVTQAHVLMGMCVGLAWRITSRM